MKDMGLGKTAALLCVVALLASGCSVMEKLGYVSMKGKYNPTLDRLAQAEAEASRLNMTSQTLGQENSDLRLSMKGAQNQLADRDAQIAALEEQMKERPAAGDTELAALRKDLQDWAEANNIQFRAERNSLVIRVQFSLGSADIAPGGKTALQAVARKVKSIPSGYAIYVDGHTDDLRVVKPETVRKHQDLLGLSLNRAASVARVLNQNGVNFAQLVPRGFADRDPLASGKTPAARRQNRRVEISIGPKPARVASINR